MEISSGFLKRMEIMFAFLDAKMHLTYIYDVIQCEAVTTKPVLLYTCSKTPPQKCL